jgi:hypothetical protein
VKFISFDIILLIIHNYPFTKAYRLLHYYHHAEEGATMNSVSNVRGRRAPDEAPRVVAGSPRSLT